MPRIPSRRSIHQNMSWVFPYTTDWGKCGPDVTMLRAYATVLRWYHRPSIRQRLLIDLVLYVGPENATLPPRMQENLNDLVDSDIELSPTIPVGRFALFLRSLNHGDIIHGGPVNPDISPEMAAVRPGFWFTFSQWTRILPDTPFPWPFWIFPRTVPLLLE